MIKNIDFIEWYGPRWGTPLMHTIRSSTKFDSFVLFANCLHFVHKIKCEFSKEFYFSLQNTQQFLNKTKNKEMKMNYLKCEKQNKRFYLILREGKDRKKK